jgi:hypothetical protein
MKHLLTATILTVSAFVGCGGGVQQTPVTGTVTLNGKEVADAVVTFVPDAGGTIAVGSTDSSGKYQLGTTDGPGAIPGAYSVKIKSREKPVNNSNPMDGLTPGSPEYIEAYKKQMSQGRNTADYAVKPKGEIPAKYESGSELKAMVGKTPETINFELKN